MPRRKEKPAFCKKGHALTNATIVVQRNGRERCMACMTEAVQKAAHTARVNRDQYRRPLVRAKARPRKPPLTCFTHRPGFLEREAAQHTRAAAGRRGGQARKGKTAGRPVPTTIILGSRT